MTQRFSLGIDMQPHDSCGETHGSGDAVTSAITSELLGLVVGIPPERLATVVELLRQLSGGNDARTNVG